MNTQSEAISVRLRPRSTFLTHTAEQFGVHLHYYVVPPEERPTLLQMEADLVEDLAAHLFPEDGVS